MLTEREIETLIWQKLRPSLTDTGLAIVQRFSKGPIKEAAHAIAEKVREDWGAEVSCDTSECLYNNDGACVQDNIHLNAYQMCESIDTE